MRSLDFVARGYEVQVWAVILDVAPEALSRLFAVLSTSEKYRLDGCQSESTRNKCIVRWAILRTLLARYLETRPSDVPICYGPMAKPRLCLAQQFFHFNSSYSGNLALYAFAAGCEVGIDVEQIRDFGDVLSIAESFFSPQELLELRSLQEPARLNSFFACWTRKEAYLKSTGQGLRAPLNSFRVTLRPEDPPAMLHVNGDCSQGRLWSIHDLRPAPSYVGAVAFAAKRALRISYFATVDQLLDSLPAEANARELHTPFDLGPISCETTETRHEC